MHADGATDWVQLDACLLESEDGDDPLVLAQVQDITQRRRQQEQLAGLAIRDPLTGLLNQRGFRDALARECEQRYQESVGLLILDLDNFKIVNDCTGHVAGDQALTEVADVLKARLRRTDLIGRQGGESSPPCCSASRKAEAAAVAEEITSAIADAHIGLNEQPVSGAIGWATLREDESPRELLARADDEMYPAQTQTQPRPQQLDPASSAAANAAVRRTAKVGIETPSTRSSGG